MKGFLAKAALAAVFGIALGITLLVGSEPHNAIAQAPDPLLGIITFKKLMQADDFTKCGLRKLSDQELANLDSWLLVYTHFVIDKMTTVTLPGGSVTADNLNDLKQYEGALIIATDGTMLGVFSNNKYDDKSVANKYGTYGSKYQTKSIWNKYGDYGSQYSDKSPFNKYTQTPPVLVLNGKGVAYLTVNTALTPRVDPNLLAVWAEIER